MYCTLRRYIKPPPQSLTYYVEVPMDPKEDPKTTTSWRKIFNKDELEQVLHERNKAHFSQAVTDKTPFTVDPLYSLLGFTANTEFSDKFCNGEIDLQWTMEYPRFTLKKTHKKNNSRAVTRQKQPRISNAFVLAGSKPEFFSYDKGWKKLRLGEPSSTVLHWRAKVCQNNVTEE
eukprot:scaffold100819_cov35-Attheya_sp.AAC.2